MKQLFYILILLLICTSPSFIYSDDNIINWEKIEVNMDSLSLFGQIEKNSKDELVLLLPTGMYKARNDDDKWTRLNIPDSLMFDNSFFRMNGPTIYTYAYTHNPKRSKNYYFVYSKNYGLNWNVIHIDELNFPGYDMSIFMYIDDKGDIWGISSNKKTDRNSLLVVNKFDIATKETKKMYDIYHTYQKLLLTDSVIVLLNTVTKPDLFDDTLSMKEISVYYSYGGTTWDSLAFNKYNTIDFEYIDGNFSSFSFIFESNGKIYTSIGSTNKSKLNLIEISLFDSKLEILDKSLSFTSQIKKHNNSTFYKTAQYESNNWFQSIFKSNDMRNWELYVSPYTIDEVNNYLKTDFYTNYWYIDKYNNHYLYNNYGILKIEDNQNVKVIGRQGLVNLDIDDFIVDSKSNITLFNKTHFDNYIVINGESKEKSIYSRAFNSESFNLFEILPNNKILLNKYNFESKKLNNYLLDNIFEQSSPMMANDSTPIILIKNPDSRGMNFLGVTETKINDTTTTFGYALSNDYCQTWTILDKLLVKEGDVDYNTFCNVNADILRAETHARVLLSTNLGETWSTVLHDSTNNLLYSNEDSHLIDLVNYNESNGSGILKYKDDGPIYYTLNHGKNWKEVDSLSQAYHFMNYYITNSKSDYRNVELPMSFDSSFVFFINTPLGVFASTDTLKSFKNISEGVIQPTDVYEFKIGNDGKLYAINNRGIWQSKEIIVSNVTNVQINEDFKNKNISVFPNPAKEFININLITNNYSESNKILNNEIAIYDVMGNLVDKIVLDLVADNITHMYDISNLSKGYYLIKFNGVTAGFIKH